MKLHIKYMVSIRCKMVVKAALDKLGLKHGAVDLGEVNIIGKMTAAQRNKLKVALLKSELELMDDHNAILVERIKNVIVEMVHYEDELIKVIDATTLSVVKQISLNGLAGDDPNSNDLFFNNPVVFGNKVYLNTSSDIVSVDLTTGAVTPLSGPDDFFFFPLFHI